MLRRQSNIRALLHSNIRALLHSLSRPPSNNRNSQWNIMQKLPMEYHSETPNGTSFRNSQWNIIHSIGNFGIIFHWKAIPHEGLNLKEDSFFPKRNHL